MKTIGFVVFPGFNLLDFAGPLAAFDNVNQFTDTPAYRCLAISPQGGAVTSSAGVEIATQPCHNARFDTLVVAGGRGNVAAAQSPVLVDFLLTQRRQTRRIASVCTGAFILAACGLLDGKRATTHWYHAAQLQQRYPRIRVDSNRIFIRDGDIWTSAGISAGIDLALAMIEDDLGENIAAGVARQLVVYHRRPGGQSQYSLLLALNPSSDRIRTALSFAREHLQRPLAVADLAAAACLSERQFGRMFRAETGQTPAKVIEQLRVEAARVRIEESSETLEAIGRAVGFSDPERMRRAFVRVFGLSPQAIKRLSRAG
ncbi:L-rhamnose operon regulatory protein rhaS [Serratia entomophila]|uniref:GlxA family transcriptional regulator n=1 Tax=Serratia entomophila TaxID=42906 RepID=UPI001F3C0EB8|nr:GlxA family transcriptional regulator [Serratia entomophila]UIW19678.1 GlxA family transcriptional regulator [Serratia entomophila]CAI0709119.1 L-rhamnose operon regulatory protein rhaS [Serratia entomophila]CAI0783057.1 L-rhamnose operon regulatory protein rhaS [Serratia entomophila]CAI0783695.1 L-rhamnose operon regulatory protein rhaS [Serratia entomophila]CAI0783989.1 L-rhamnose operon regulatory protein rhaS [Serratia entomophila]